MNRRDSLNENSAASSLLAISRWTNSCFPIKKEFFNSKDRHRAFFKVQEVGIHPRSWHSSVLTNCSPKELTSTCARI